jgi:hypothetical protein
MSFSEFRVPLARIDRRDLLLLLSSSRETIHYLPAILHATFSRDWSPENCRTIRKHQQEVPPEQPTSTTVFTSTAGLLLYSPSSSTTLYYTLLML